MAVQGWDTLHHGGSHGPSAVDSSRLRLARRAGQPVGELAAVGLALVRTGMD